MVYGVYEHSVLEFCPSPSVPKTRKTYTICFRPHVNRCRRIYSRGPLEKADIFENNRIWIGNVNAHRTQLEQDRRCTYNVTLRRVRVTIVAVEKQYYIFRVCICSASAVLYHLWPVWLYHIFSHYFIKGTIFRGKKRYWTWRVFWFSLQILSGTFLILRRAEGSMIVNVYWSSSKIFIILVRF